MSGNKSTKRALSYTTPIADYRVVAAADGPVDPDNPPDVPLIDNIESVLADNVMFLYLIPEVGQTATVQVWVVQDEAWYFHSEAALAVAGRPEVVKVSGIPAGEYAVVATVLSGGNLTIGEEHSE